MTGTHGRFCPLDVGTALKKQKEHHLHNGNTGGFLGRVCAGTALKKQKEEDIFHCLRDTQFLTPNAGP